MVALVFLKRFELLWQCVLFSCSTTPHRQRCQGPTAVTAGWTESRSCGCQRLTDWATQSRSTRKSRGQSRYPCRTPSSSWKALVPQGISPKQNSREPSWQFSLYVWRVSRSSRSPPEQQNEMYSQSLLTLGRPGIPLWNLLQYDSQGCYLVAKRIAQKSFLFVPSLITRAFYIFYRIILQSTWMAIAKSFQRSSGSQIPLCFWKAFPGGAGFSSRLFPRLFWSCSRTNWKILDMANAPSFYNSV